MGDGLEPLLTELTTSQRRRLIYGVANPFFWAGIELMGTPCNCDQIFADSFSLSISRSLSVICVILSVRF